MFRYLDAWGELLIFFRSDGAVAQLGERLNGIQEVVSSILSSSTILIKTLIYNYLVIQ